MYIQLLCFNYIYVLCTLYFLISNETQKQTNLNHANYDVKVVSPKSQRNGNFFFVIIFIRTRDYVNSALDVYNFRVGAYVRGYSFFASEPAYTIYVYYTDG